MKLLKPQKVVNYFGIDFLLPQESGWLATDSDGDVYWYQEKPILRTSHWTVEDAYFGVATVDLDGMDWKDTIVEIL